MDEVLSEVYTRDEDLTTVRYLPLSISHHKGHDLYLQREEKRGDQRGLGKTGEGKGKRRKERENMIKASKGKAGFI